MDLIQNALDKAMSVAKSETFFQDFGPFLDSLGGFESKSPLTISGSLKKMIEYFMLIVVSFP